MSPTTTDKQTDGLVLIACRGGEYYFAATVYRDEDGCRGYVVRPVTQVMLDDMLLTDSLTERFGGYWEEEHKDDVCSECEACDGWLDEDGCEDCGYPSCESFCEEIGEREGLDAVVDDPGCEYAKALNAVCDDEIVCVDRTGFGRIFGSFDKDMPTTPDDFDEVYNMKALVAILAYEDDAVDYNYATKTIFGG